MATERLPMRSIREILRQKLKLERTHREVVAATGASLGMVGKVTSRFEKLKLSWADIEATLPGVAEGAYTVEAALALAERLGVEMPIAREV